MSIKKLARHEQPREKLMEKGAGNLRDHELMAILLGTGTKDRDVMQVAKDILNKFPKKKLLSLDFKTLAKVKGLGPAKACLLLSAFELTKRALEVEDNNLPAINSAKDAVAQLQELRTAKKEHFVAIYLDARNRMIHKEIISMGIINASLVHPREIFKPAIDCLACSVIIAHNHPSGDVSPSESDIETTARLREAGMMLGVEIIDHIIITEKDYRCI